MKKFVSMFLILLVASCLKAQDNINYNSFPIDTSVLFLQKGQLVDAVKKRIFSSNEDSDRVWKYYLLSQQYTFNNADTALTYAQKGLDLAKKIHFETGEYYCSQIASWNLIFNGNYTGSLSIEFDLSRRLEKTDNYYRQAWNLQDIGFAYLTGGDGQTALNYLHQAWEKIQPHLNAFPFTGEVILINIGKAYENLNKWDSALLSIKKSYVIDTQTKRQWSSPLLSMGDIYTKQGHYEMGLDFYRKAYYSAVYLVDILGSYNGIANIFEKTGLFDSAVFYAHKSISKGKEFPFSVIPAYNTLSRIYKAKHVFDSAFKYQQLAYDLRDSVLNREKSKQLQNFLFNEQQRQKEIQQAQEQYRNKIKMYLMFAALAIFLLIAFIFWRNYRNKLKANLLLQQQKEKVETTLAELKSTQSQLIQSEKMASLGELTAGIAHEIQNPLNFVNNFSEVNKELLVEMNEEIEKGNLNEVKAIAKDIIDNEEKINHHGKRADAIVKGMLQHSRTSSGVKEPTDINKLADEYLRLAYHGLRAKDKSFNATMKTDYDESIGNINIIPQDIGRVILNLITNAFYAVSAKASAAADAAPLPPPVGGGFKNPQDKHEPTVWVSTKKVGDKVFISVRDNGPGIPQKILDKIFQPFFTTKPTGQGTGLGLSLAYDIVKAHGGELKMETKEGEGSEFIIQLPASA
jgi:signal transduction histidine kinase